MAEPFDNTRSAPAPVHESASSRSARLLRCLPALLLPLVIWAACTLFLGADLGKNSDDYFLNLRDPATGAIPEGTSLYRHFPYFWRPLHIAMTFGVGTYFWEYDRAIHIFVALMHGAACLGLWLLLRRTLRSAIAPAAATLLFMALPLHHEVVFWFSTACTSIGTAIFLATSLVVVRFARAERGGYPLLIPIFVLTFLITCFYEQSAAGIAAFPALCLAVAPGSQRLLTRLYRSAAATAAAGMACIVYIAIFRATAPDFARGSAASMVRDVRLRERITEVARAVTDGLWGERARHTWNGSLQQGWETVASPEGVVWGGLILAAAATWLIWAWSGGWSEATASGSPRNNKPLIRHIWLAVFGLAIFILAWLPVAALDRQNVVPRNYYVPLLGLAVTLGSALDAILVTISVHGRRSLAASTASVAIAALALSGALLGTIGLVGFQMQVQARWRLDQDELRQLSELVPNPPPGAVFMPMDTRLSRPAHTGLIMFDKCRPGVFETQWSASSAIRRLYHRNDVHSTACNPWIPSSGFLKEPTESGVRYSGKLGRGFVRHPEGGSIVPWDRTIPFTVDADGRVRLVRRIDVEKADHRDLAIRPRFVHDILTNRRARGLTTPVTPVRLASPEERLDLLPIEEWEWHARRSPVEFTSVWIWADSENRRDPRKATWLHPTANSGDRSAISIAMPARERAQLLLIRATIAEYDLQQAGLLPPAPSPSSPSSQASPTPAGALADAPAQDVAVMELSVAFASTPNQPLGVLRLDPKELATGKRWIPFIVEIPGTTSEDRWVLSVSTAPGQSKDARSLPVWITHGYEQLPPIQNP